MSRCGAGEETIYHSVTSCNPIITMHIRDDLAALLSFIRNDTVKLVDELYIHIYCFLKYAKYSCPHWRITITWLQSQTIIQFFPTSQWYNIEANTKVLLTWEKSFTGAVDVWNSSKTSTLFRCERSCMYNVKIVIQNTLSYQAIDFNAMTCQTLG